MSDKVMLFGEVKSPMAYTIRDFLQRNDISFEWIDVSVDPDALRSFGMPYGCQLPVLTIGAVRLYAPDLRDIAAAVGFSVRPALPEYDLAIVGAGPAGLSAAVYGASEGLRTILVERFSMGGQAGSTSRIENYLGFPKGISGAELASRAREQAVRFGTEILLAADCEDGTIEDDRFNLTLDNGQTITSRAVICATGVEYGRLQLPEEDRFIGRGLYYGAGASEANLCSDHVFVVGGGNSAGQAALHLAARAEKVTMLVRGESLKSTLSQYLIDRIRLAKNIHVKTHTVVSQIDGNEVLERISYKRLDVMEDCVEQTGWVFVCIGGTPRTDWTGSTDVSRDPAGYLLTGTDLLPPTRSAVRWTAQRNPFPMETSIPGSFAAGDIRATSIKRCATAVGEGAMAVASVHRYLEAQK